MTDNHSSPENSSTAETSQRGGWQRPVIAFCSVLGIYFVVAYVILPFGWEQFEKRHPAFDGDPRITVTGDKHPGDPLNVALIGTAEELQQILAAAQWFPANPLGLKSDLKIAVDTVLERPYNEAPVSNLFLFGRKEDFAFEQPVGDNPRQRHHVRFWKSPTSDPAGRPIWLGSATYDERVGLSHTTGQITHHISGDVDAERNHLMQNLEQTKQLSETYQIPDFHPVKEGRNGGGDLWKTDGALSVGVIAPK